MNFGAQPGPDSPHPNYGVLAAFIGNVVAVAVGVDASRTVAIQCIGGRSFDKYIFFNGSVELPDRYEGMKVAFGSDNEIFIPKNAGYTARPFPLNSMEYDRLINATIEKFEMAMVPHEQLNSHLRERNQFPIWRWLPHYLGYFAACICTGFALLPVVVIAIVRWATGANWVAGVVHVVLFMLVSAYDGVLLDMKRDVAYIRVDKTSVSPSLRDLWLRLHDRASSGPPNSAIDAVKEIAKGKARKDGQALLIPVMAIRPSVEFNTASWLLMLTHLRAPLLTTSYFLTTDLSFYWIATFCSAIFAQACLQNMLANRFCTFATPLNVIWFRRMPTHDYTEEHRAYRMVLG